jgi:hypothetical protein
VHLFVHSGIGSPFVSDLYIREDRIHYLRFHPTRNLVREEKECYAQNSHIFLGWTNQRFPTSLSSFFEVEAELQESFLYLYG